MPVSEMVNVPSIMNEIVRLQPKSICELGIGFGKYGVLCREALEAVNGKCRPGEWERLIIGYEAFPRYNNPCWEMYNVVITEDFTKCTSAIAMHDVVLMIDSLEHLEKDQARIFLDTLVRSNRQVIVSVPIGNWPQGAVFGNEFERHRSIWTGEEEFANYDYRVLHRGICLVVSIKGGL
jgi:hypothetical protein